MKKFCTAICFLCILTASANSIRNGDFERTLKPWSGCYGNKGAFLLDAVGHSGKQSLKLSADGTHEVRVYNRGNYIRNSFGQQWTLSLWAKGTGSLSIGAHEHSAPTDKLGLIHLGYFWSKPAVLTPEWKQYRFTYTSSLGNLTSFLPMIRLQGSGCSAWIDDIILKKTPAPDWKLECEPANIVTYPGCEFKLQLKVTRNGMPVSGESIAFSSPVLNPRGNQNFRTDADGQAVISLKLPTTQKISVQMLGAGLPERGIGRSIFVDIIPETLYRKLDQLGAGAKNPGRVLVIGDSLTDFLRGYNYVSTLEYFLGRHNPGKAEWLNYGIRGDKIPRTLGRFQHKKEWSWERYQGIWDEKPEAVLIFLGHNDSLMRDQKLGAQSPTQVPAEQFRRQMLELIQEVRKVYGNPRVILLTPVQQDYQKSIVNSRKYKLKSASGEPTIARRFRDLVMEIGRTAGCSVIDVHTPTAQYPDRDKIFNIDGVHVNALGNKIIAEAVLKALQ